MCDLRCGMKSHGYIAEYLLRSQITYPTASFLRSLCVDFVHATQTLTTYAYGVPSQSLGLPHHSQAWA
jgi:hypothetical protein